MKKTLKLWNLDCAGCAMKIEEAVKKLDGVISVSVNFMGQRMILETEDGCSDSVSAQVVKLVRRIEPDVTVKL